MTTTLSVRLSAEDRQRLERRAVARGVCASELVRQLVAADDSPEVAPGWDEVLAEVRARCAEIEDAARQPNPVLVARQKRNFHARLR